MSHMEQRRKLLAEKNDLQEKVTNFRNAYGRAIDDRNKVLSCAEQYGKALRDIKKHIEIVLPNGFTMSAVWVIAKKALYDYL